MSITILIKRKWKTDHPQTLLPLLNKIRAIAATHPGYLSSQTMRNTDKNNEFLVLSRWETLKDWHDWLASKDRIATQGEIDSLIGEKTFFEIYETVNDQGEVLSGMR